MIKIDVVGINFSIWKVSGHYHVTIDNYGQPKTFLVLFSIFIIPFYYFFLFLFLKKRHTLFVQVLNYCYSIIKNNIKKEVTNYWVFFFGYYFVGFCFFCNMHAYNLLFIRFYAPKYPQEATLHLHPHKCLPQVWPLSIIWTHEKKCENYTVSKESCLEGKKSIENYCVGKGACCGEEKI